MNRWLPSLMVAGLLAAIPARPVQADEGNTEMGGHEFHHGFGKMHDGLELSKDQKTKLKDLMEKQEAALKPLMRKLRDLHIKLRDQIEDKAGDADVKTTLNEMKAGHKAMMEQMEKFRGEKENILTPTQMAKMELWHMKGHRHGEESWMGKGHDGEMDGHHEGHHDGDGHGDDRGDHDGDR